MSTIFLAGLMNGGGRRGAGANVGCERDNTDDDDDDNDDNEEARASCGEAAEKIGFAGIGGWEGRGTKLF